MAFPLMENMDGLDGAGRNVCHCYWLREGQSRQESLGKDGRNKSLGNEGARSVRQLTSCYSCFVYKVRRIYSLID